MSVQRAASWVLDKYYTEFPTYNPYLDRLVHPGVPGNRGSRRGVKVYDIDGHGANINDGNSTVVSVASKRGKQQDLTTPDHHRFLEEYDHERKVRKRKARLLTATEEAFTHIRRLRENQNTTSKHIRTSQLSRTT